jgi:hypothetical protein
MAAGEPLRGQNRGRMYLHVYLPDELGAEAKKAKLNLSGLLRRAVEAELRGDAAPEVDVRRSGRGVEIVVSVPAALLPDRP